MAGNIKGITIEIGGNTQKLDQALKSVNQTAKSLEKELKAVDKALKVHGGTVGHPVTLDSDGIAVLRIADTKTQTIEFIATKSGVTSSVTLSLKDLVLEPEE